MINILLLPNGGLLVWLLSSRWLRARRQLPDWGSGDIGATSTLVFLVYHQEKCSDLGFDRQRGRKNPRCQFDVC